MFFFFKQKTAYEMRISDWSSDVCSSDLGRRLSRWHSADRALGLVVSRYGDDRAPRAAAQHDPGAAHPHPQQLQADAAELVLHRRAVQHQSDEREERTSETYEEAAQQGYSASPRREIGREHVRNNDTN